VDAALATGASRYVQESIACVNTRFKTVTGWQPQFASALEGWDFVIAEWRAHQAVGSTSVPGLAAKPDVR
jgi:hypothetical protein